MYIHMYDKLLDQVLHSNFSFCILELTNSSVEDTFVSLSSVFGGSKLSIDFDFLSWDSLILLNSGLLGRGPSISIPRLIARFLSS